MPLAREIGKIKFTQRAVLDMIRSVHPRSQTENRPSRKGRRAATLHQGVSRQLHGDYDAIVLHGNGCAPCCGLEPMLRVRTERTAVRGVTYVEYECRRCGKRGGASLFEDTARAYWNEGSES